MSEGVLQAKRAAARAALDFVKEGMVLGLGSGSTAEIFIESLQEKLASGLRLKGAVATSKRTQMLAAERGIPLLPLHEAGVIHLVIDGADEIDPQCNLIKGLGGALLLEKIVAWQSQEMIVIADDSKEVPALGSLVPLPIEVPPFLEEGLPSQIARALHEHAGAPLSITIRRDQDGGVIKTDGGNVIYDCQMGVIKNPKDLAKRLDSIPSILSHGLFIGLASRAIIGKNDGDVRILKQ